LNTFVVEREDLGGVDDEVGEVNTESSRIRATFINAKKMKGEYETVLQVMVCSPVEFQMVLSVGDVIEIATH